MALLVPQWQFFSDSNGDPASAGTVDFFDDGTTTPKSIWSDPARTVVLANPQTLDGNGRLTTNIYCVDGERYTVHAKDSSGADLPGYPADEIWGHIEEDEGVNQSYTPGVTGGVARTVASKLTDNPSVKDVGAVGNGTTDDWTALQRAIDNNQIYDMPPGKYRITQPLLFDPIRNRNAGFRGLVVPSIYPETTQTGGPTWDGDDECVIFYDGPTGVTTAVIAASPEAIGTEPTSTFENTIYGLKLENITIDGNDKAQYGLYMARVQDSDIHNVVFRNCEGDGLYINGSFSGKFSSIVARSNGGRGISVGAAREDLSWSTNNLCNALTFIDVWCYSNGKDGAFDESTDPNKGCGMYFSPHRNCTILGLNCEVNDGVGCVFYPTSSGNSIRNFYAELNSNFDHTGSGSALSSGRTTRRYAMRYEGYTGNVSYGNKVDAGFIAAEYLWITGTEPSTGRPESAPEFRDILGGAGVVATYANYRLVNMGDGFTSNIIGSSPTGASHHLQGLILGANSNAALNEYREGNFTPTVEGSTVAGTSWGYDVNQGRYTRIGRTVFVSIEIDLNAIGGSASGNVIIKGLPFTVKNENGQDGCFTVSQFQNLTTALVGITARAPINGTDIELYKLAAAGTSETTLDITNISATTILYLSGWYVVA